MTDETIFYIGIGASCLAASGIVLSLLINKISSLKLSTILDEEYGKEKKVSE